MPLTKKELPLARSLCWHCQSEVGGEYLCTRCVKVQPLSKDLDYFTCLELPRKLNIDTAKLEATYYEASRAFHPDFYEGKSDVERAVSLANSALLNQAYRTLKDPIRRVEYLLRLEAGASKDIPQKAPMDLFETLLEIQEHLETLKTLQPRSGPAVEDLIVQLRTERSRLEAKRAALETRLAELFRIWDRLVDKAEHEPGLRPDKAQVLQEMRDILSQRNYLGTVLSNIEEALG